MSENLKDPESTVRFLIEQALKESEIAWIRINFMLAVQLAAIAGLVTLLAAEAGPPRIVVIALCGLGLLSCLFWAQITRMSRYYNDVWLRDACWLASQYGLDGTFAHGLGFVEQQPAGYEQSKQGSFFSIRRPTKPAISASKSVFCLIAIFMFAWMVLGWWAFVRLTT